jgi:hypothetical protein
VCECVCVCMCVWGGGCCSWPPLRASVSHTRSAQMSYSFRQVTTSTNVQLTISMGRCEEEIHLLADPVLFWQVPVPSLGPAILVMILVLITSRYCRYLEKSSTQCKAACHCCIIIGVSHAFGPAPSLLGKETGGVNLPIVGSRICHGSMPGLPA